MIRRGALAILASGVGLLTFLGQASTQDLPKTHLRIVGGPSNLSAYTDFERPFWMEKIPELSGGQVTAEIKGFNEMGLKGPEMMRLMSQGVIEFGTSPIAYFASDNPINEAVDLAGLSPTVADARAAADAFTPVLAEFYEQDAAVKLLGISPYSAQVFFCNAEVNALADLKGKKIRTGTRSQAELIEALGATSVNLAFGEVVPALQNKVVDCAITGSLSGFHSKVYEVSTHLYALPVSWAQPIHAVNRAAWDSLDPGVQTLIETNIKTLIDDLWDAAEKDTQLGYDCNSGAESCDYPEKGSMKLILPTEEELATLKQILETTVIPSWAARCSAACVDGFNDTIAKALNLARVE